MIEYPRLRHFDDGIAMVVTDLHGEGLVFDHIMQTFFDLLESGKADRLILCGDLIHIRRAVPDDSLRMMMEVIKWQKKLGEDTITMLMGNHEMPHVYNITLAKGRDEFTAPFEKALTKYGTRDEVYKFLRGLPIYVTTNAGVLISHAGATPAVTKAHEAQNILTFDHDALLQLGEDRLLNSVDIEQLKSDKNYLRQAMTFTGVTGIDDPRFHHMLRGQILSQGEDEFEFLWDVLFARNEQKWGVEAYTFIAEEFLQAIGDVTENILNVVVAGHIGTIGGHQLVGKKHLRLSSFAHAHPNDTGEYLLLDCATKINMATDLLPHLRPVYK